MHRVKTLRRAQGWSQAVLAEKAGLAREYVARLELGQHDPSLSTIVKLAKALKVPVSRLVD